MDKNVIEHNKKNIWLDTIEDDEAFEFTNTLFGSNWEVSQKKSPRYVYLHFFFERKNVDIRTEGFSANSRQDSHSKWL